MLCVLFALHTYITRGYKTVCETKIKFEKDIVERSKRSPIVFWSHASSKLKTKSGIGPLLEDTKIKSTMRFIDIERLISYKNNLRAHSRKSQLVICLPSDKAPGRRTPPKTPERARRYHFNSIDNHFPTFESYRWIRNMRMSSQFLKRDQKV